MRQISKTIYLDYAASTPVDPRVLKAMLPFFAEKFGNTMSLHRFGQEAKAALENSREIIANFLGAESGEIILTSSATESNNLALKGVAFANRKKGNPARNTSYSDAGGHLIISKIEHPCVMESAKWLEAQGFRITKLPVDNYGIIDPKKVEKAIKKETILVSIIHASNEIGTIQDIERIGKICKRKGVYFHTDCAQSFGKIPINVNEMDIDLLTASSHKIYGPKGAALLYIREGTKIEPILHGGGQESGLRSSTVNVPAIVGFAKACQLCQKEIHPVKSFRGGISSKTKLFNGAKNEKERLTKLRNKLIKGMTGKISGSRLLGHPQKRLPNNANFSFDFVEGESIIIQLDLAGIAASTGSACSSAVLEPSHVLLAMGLKREQAHSSVRLSLGRWTKESDIDYVLKVLPGIITRLRKISGAVLNQ